jgi:hypothetical protein
MKNESLNISAPGFALYLINKHENMLAGELILLYNGYSEPLSPGVKGKDH